MSQLLEIAKTAALTAGSILKNGFRTSCTMHSKQGIHNLVTEYDIASEAVIISIIKQTFPEHSILSEECGHIDNNSDIQWIIDPLDGTVNFAHGIPIFSVSIAAVQNGEPICGVIYAPMTDELFFAEKGHGAFLHDFPIHVTDTKNIEDCILVTGFPYNVKDNPENCIGHIAGILSLGIPIRRLGSAALDIAYVASGRFDGFWEVSLQSWDFAAGLLLLKEAGGSIVNYDGSPFTILKGGTFLATNGFIEKAMIEALQHADILYPRVR